VITPLKKKATSRSFRAIAASIGCSPGRNRSAADHFMVSDKYFADFDDLNVPISPNTWLVAPLDFAPAKPDATAPVFDVPAKRLAQAWISVVESEPRTKILAVSGDGLQIEAEQRSAVFGFVDRISTRVIALEPIRSTLVAYSRSQVGYWDLGANRRRLQLWLAKLKAKAGVSG
jgi:uncharacterized protein (DUF1499 family)